MLRQVGEAELRPVTNSRRNTRLSLVLCVPTAWRGNYCVSASNGKRALGGYCDKEEARGRCELSAGGKEIARGKISTRNLTTAAGTATQRPKRKSYST
jgi:hypothetical protein